MAIRVVGVLLFLITNLAFFNMVELPIASASKATIHKQLDNGMYGSNAYTLGLAIAHMPLALVDTFVFGVLTYLIAGLAYEADAIFVFLGILFIYSLAMSAQFRSVALLAPSQTVAQLFAPALTVPLMLYAGFIIPEEVSRKRGVSQGSHVSFSCSFYLLNSFSLLFFLLSSLFSTESTTRTCQISWCGCTGWTRWPGATARSCRTS